MKVNVGCNGLTMAELARICGGLLCCVGGEVNRNLPFRSVWEKFTTKTGKSRATSPILPST